MNDPSFPNVQQLLQINEISANTETLSTNPYESQQQDYKQVQIQDENTQNQFSNLTNSEQMLVTNNNYIQGYGLESIIQEAATEEENTTLEQINQIYPRIINKDEQFEEKIEKENKGDDDEVTIEEVFQILRKEPDQRTNIDLISLHKYLSKENQFFIQLSKEKGTFEVFKIYKLITLQVFPKNSIIFKYGDVGEFFYIILKGVVGLKVPTDLNVVCKNYFDIMRQLVANYSNLVKLKDNHSRVVKKLIDIIGISSLLNSQCKDMTSLIVFLEEAKAQFLAKNPNLDPQTVLTILNQKEEDLQSQSQQEQYLFQEAQKFQFICEFQKQLRIQLESKKEYSFQIQIQILRETVQLIAGKGFGELSLITDKERSGTAFAKESFVALALLNKKDYKLMIGDTFKLKMEKAIEAISRFEIFKSLSQRRLIATYYYLKERNYLRNQFLYKQGDPVEGIFLVVKGEVQKVKHIQKQSSMSQIEAQQQQQHYVYEEQSKHKEQQLSGSNFNVVLSIIPNNEVLGTEEILSSPQQPRREYSVQVTSEKAFILFMSKRDFIERILIVYPNVKNQLKSQLHLRYQFYEKRQETVGKQQQREEEENLRIQGIINSNSKSKEGGLGRDNSLKQLIKFQNLVDNNEKPVAAGGDQMNRLQGEYEKLLKLEFNTKMTYKRGGMSQQQLDIITKAFDNERMNLFQKGKKQKKKNKQPRQQKMERVQSEMKKFDDKYGIDQNDESATKHKSKQKSYSPNIISGSVIGQDSSVLQQSFQQQYLSKNAKMEILKGYHSSLQFLNNNNKSSKIDQFSPVSSMSLRGKQNENLLQKQYALKSTSDEKRSFTLEKITAKLQKDINKDLEDLRYDKEKKQLMKYLKEFKYKETIKQEDSPVQNNKQTISNNNNGNNVGLQKQSTKVLESQQQQEQKFKTLEQQDDSNSLLEIEDFDKQEYQMKMKKLYQPQTVRNNNNNLFVQSRKGSNNNNSVPSSQLASLTASTKEKQKKQFNFNQDIVDDQGIKFDQKDKEKGISPHPHSSAVYTNIWKNFQNHKKNKEEMDDIIQKQQQSQIIRSIAIPNSAKSIVFNNQMMMMQQLNQKTPTIYQNNDISNIQNLDNSQKQFDHQGMQLQQQQQEMKFVGKSKFMSKLTQDKKVKSRNVHINNIGSDIAKDDQKSYIWQPSMNQQFKTSLQQQHADKQTNDYLFGKPKKQLDANTEFQSLKPYQQQIIDYRSIFKEKKPVQIPSIKTLKKMSQQSSPINSQYKEFSTPTNIYSEGTGGENTSNKIKGKKKLLQNIKNQQQQINTSMISSYLKNQQTSNVQQFNFNPLFLNQQQNAEQFSSFTVGINTPHQLGGINIMKKQSNSVQRIVSELATPRVIEIKQQIYKSNQGNINSERNSEIILISDEDLKKAYQKFYGNLLTTRSTSQKNGLVKQTNQDDSYPINQFWSSNSVSPLSKSRSNHQLFSNKKLHEILPVKELFPDAKEIKRKQPFEHKVLKKQSVKDIQRIQKSMIQDL